MGKIKYLYEFEIPRFIERIELSKKRRAQYYKKNGRIPEKYKKDKYTFNESGILIDTETGDKVIKNSRSVGTPNVKKINSQYFWSGANPHIRRKIKRDMSNFIMNYVRKIPQVKLYQYPVGISLDLYDIMEGENDLDNFVFLWWKTLLDTLTAKDMDHRPVIIDDSRKYLRELIARYHPIENHDDRSIIVRIYSLH